MRRIRFSVLRRGGAIVLGLLGACAGGDPDGSELGTVPDRLAEAICTKAYTCCRDEDIAVAAGLRPNMAKCLEDMRSVYYRVATWRDEIRRGRTEYRPEVMAVCLARLKELTCPEFGGQYYDGWAKLPVPECALKLWMRGKLPVGSSCDYTWQCDNGLCSRRGSELVGTCLAVRPENESCSKWHCPDPGTYCDNVKDRCLPLKADGAACQAPNECMGLRCPTKVCTTGPAWCVGR